MAYALRYDRTNRPKRARRIQTMALCVKGGTPPPNPKRVREDLSYGLMR